MQTATQINQNVPIPFPFTTHDYFLNLQSACYKLNDLFTKQNSKQILCCPTG